MTLTYSPGSWPLESFIIRPVQIKVYIFRHARPPWWFWGNSADRSLSRKFTFGLDLNWIGLDLDWIGKLLTSYNNIQLNTMASQSVTETKLFTGMLGPNEVSLIFCFVCVFFCLLFQLPFRVALKSWVGLVLGNSAEMFFFTCRDNTRRVLVLRTKRIHEDLSKEREWVKNNPR